mmetsp:Transcript_20038/g.76759  ORF Transcript_20038/g.76759 Transcript_20038/m.76759 type:complete len:336 (-) Transcript_20038:70-1077(-)
MEGEVPGLKRCLARLLLAGEVWCVRELDEESPVVLVHLLEDIPVPCALSLVRAPDANAPLRVALRPHHSRDGVVDTLVDQCQGSLVPNGAVEHGAVVLELPPPSLEEDTGRDVGVLVKTFLGLTVGKENIALTAVVKPVVKRQSVDACLHRPPLVTGMDVLFKLLRCSQWQTAVGEKETLLHDVVRLLVSRACLDVHCRRVCHLSSVVPTNAEVARLLARPQVHCPLPPGALLARVVEDLRDAVDGADLLEEVADVVLAGIEAEVLHLDLVFLAERRSLHKSKFVGLGEWNILHWIVFDRLLVHVLVRRVARRQLGREIRHSHQFSCCQEQYCGK